MASLSQKILLMGGILRGKKALTGPVEVLVDVTGRCNLNCVGCLAHSPVLENAPSLDKALPADLSYSAFTRLCDELPRKGKTTLTLAGEGEPLLHPQLPEMISYAKTSGLKTVLNTNGTLLTPESSGALVLAGLDKLVFSLWAIDPEGADEVYPGRGRATLAAQLKGLKNLKHEKQVAGGTNPEVVLYHPLNNRTMNHPEAFIRLAQEYGADSVHLSPLRTRQGRISFLAPEKEQIETLKSLARSEKGTVKVHLEQVLLAFELGEKVWEHAPCFRGWFGLFFDRSGTLRPCKMCDVKLGTLEKSSLSEIWNGPAMRNFREKTRTRKGLAGLLDTCDCEYCCFSAINYAIYRKIKWFTEK